MKFYKGSKKRGILLIAILALFTLSTEVFAGKIKRGCTAGYYAHVIGFDYNYNTSTRKMEETKHIPLDILNVAFGEEYKFKAHGSCGKLVPNRCRKRARDALLPCVKAHVKSPKQMPKECRSDSIEKYPIQNLKSIIEKKVCKPLYTRDGFLVTYFPKPYQVHLILGAAIRGKQGCGKEGLSKHTVVDGKNYTITGSDSSARLPLKKVSVTCR